MNAFALKIIAYITMFLDHIGYVIFKGSPSYFNYIGRLSFPIFAFQISEGYIHTSNIKKYLIRLFILGIVSQIPFMLFYSIISQTFILNVIFTLFFGLLSIIIYDKCNKFLGFCVSILLGLTAQILKFDYGFYGVFITFLFYACHKNKFFMTIMFILSTIINYLHKILQYNSFGFDFFKFAFQFYIPYAIFTMFSIMPILLYNKKKGPNTKYLLYLFYPLHLIFCYFISFFH